MEFVVGIDGGGTSCKCAIADLSGKILGRGMSGPANVASDMATAINHIIEAAEAAADAAGLKKSALSNASSFLGLAGHNVDSQDDSVARALPFKRSWIEDDSGIALQGALGDSEGIIAVLGTGSVYLGRKGTELRRAGGWGFMVGDLGSGSRLGRALLQDTLLAFDNIMPRSPLTRVVMSEFDFDPIKLVKRAQNEKPGGFAKYAPLVFKYAEKGDLVAANLVRGAVAHVDAALSAIVWPGCERLSLLGGLSHLYASRIDPQFRALLKAPEGDAVDGAIQLGLRRFFPDRVQMGGTA